MYQNVGTAKEKAFIIKLTQFEYEDKKGRKLKMYMTHNLNYRTDRYLRDC